MACRADLEGAPSIFFAEIGCLTFVLVPQAKSMHQIMWTDFENSNFSLILRGHIPLRHPLSPQAPKFCQSLIWDPVLKILDPPLAREERRSHMMVRAMPSARAKCRTKCQIFDPSLATRALIFGYAHKKTPSYFFTHVPAKEPMFSFLNCHPKTFFLKTSDLPEFDDIFRIFYQTHIVHCNNNNNKTHTQNTPLSLALYHNRMNPW